MRDAPYSMRLHLNHALRRTPQFRCAGCCRAVQNAVVHKITEVNKAPAAVSKWLPISTCKFILNSIPMAYTPVPNVLQGSSPAAPTLAPDGTAHTSAHSWVPDRGATSSMLLPRSATCTARTLQHCCCAAGYHCDD